MSSNIFPARAAAHFVTGLALLFAITAADGAAGQSRLRGIRGGATDRATPAAKNSWRGITPLHSSAADVARVIGEGADQTQAVGPFRVEGGEVTFSYLTDSLAKIYRAPRSMAGKVFTIYFKPDQPASRAELKLPGFKRCSEDRNRTNYYMVNEAGVAYQFRSNDDTVETIIYQPSRAEVRRLAVMSECVF